ncbi:hypothetical protein D3C80_2109180 [compost metagenome]
MHDLASPQSIGLQSVVNDVKQHLVAAIPGQPESESEARSPVIRKAISEMLEGGDR